MHPSPETVVGHRVVVWVQFFGNRPYLMLQWYDPSSGELRSQSAETCNPREAEMRRAALEQELNRPSHLMDCRWRIAKMCRAMGDVPRLRLLALLAEGEWCVTEL